MTDGRFLADYFDVNRKQDFMYDYDSIVMGKIALNANSVEEVIAFYCHYYSLPRAGGEHAL